MNLLDPYSSSHELTEEQIKFLEEELEACRKNPEESFTWEEVKSRLIKKQEDSN